MNEEEDPRRRVIRTTRLYARVFAAAAILVALTGSALIARFVLGDMDFVPALLLVLGTVGTAVLLIVAVRALLERNRRGSRDGEPNDMNDRRGEA